MQHELYNRITSLAYEQIQRCIRDLLTGEDGTKKELLVGEMRGVFWLWDAITIDCQTPETRKLMHELTFNPARWD